MKTRHRLAQPAGGHHVTKTSRNSDRRNDPEALRSREMELPKKRHPRLGFLLRAVLLLALVSVASSSRDDTASLVPDGSTPPSPAGLQWLATTTYNPGDVVEFNGELYQATAASGNTDESPGTSPAFWTLFPEAGRPWNRLRWGRADGKRDRVRAMH